MLRNRTLRAVVRDFGQHWPQLFLTIGVYNVIAVVLLTPLLALLSQILLRLSGKPVLADQDILFFLLQPAGWICAVTLGALWLCIIVLGQVALIGILAAPRFSNDSDSDQDTKLGTVSAIQFALSQTWQVSQITAWVIIRVGLLATPFLAIAGITYFFLLSEFDINFYLQAKPPKFIVAVGIGLALLITFIILLLRFLAGWLFALPMVLFENTPISKALQESSRRTHGLRSQIIRVVSIWLGTGLGLSAMTTSLLLLFGRLIIPDAASSLGLLVISLGIFVLIWTVVHILIQMTSSGLFASLWWNLYREFGCNDRIAAFGVHKPTTSRTRNDRFRITGTRLIVVSMLGLITAACIGIWTLNSVRLDDDVDIIAHRGASADAPENTLAAMNQAIEYSTDWVEIDVQQTGDGEVVVFHDSDFMKLANNNLKIWDATMSDLENIDIGSHKDPIFSMERVPTLSQLLTTCKGKTGVVIELKYYGHDDDLEQQVLNIVNAHDMSSDVMYMSLNLNAVGKMKQLAPDCRAGLLMSVIGGSIDNTKADFLAVNAMFIDRAFIQRAHASGKDVFVWTVNDAVTMSRMISLGADGIITDRPDLARRVLTERAKMNPAERLLLQLSETFGIRPVVTEQ